jgi:hypothetical protein
MSRGTAVYGRPFSADGNDSEVGRYKDFIAAEALTCGDAVMFTVAEKMKKVSKATSGADARVIGIYEGFGGNGAADASYLAAMLAEGITPQSAEPKAAVAGDVVAIKVFGPAVGRVLGVASFAAGDATKVGATAGTLERDQTVMLLHVTLDIAYTTAAVAFKRIFVNLGKG